MAVPAGLAGSGGRSVEAGLGVVGAPGFAGWCAAAGVANAPAPPLLVRLAEVSVDASVSVLGLDCSGQARRGRCRHGPLERRDVGGTASARGGARVGADGVYAEGQDNAVGGRDAGGPGRYGSESSVEGQDGPEGGDRAGDGSGAGSRDHAGNGNRQSIDLRETPASAEHRALARLPAPAGQPRPTTPPYPAPDGQPVRTGRLLVSAAEPRHEPLPPAAETAAHPSPGPPRARTRARTSTGHPP